MILYKVRTGVITVLSVAKETPCGWREHSNGFINRRVMGTFPSLNDAYYTTDLSEAKKWSAVIVSKMEDYIQVSKASLHDVDFWQEEMDGDESSIPRPRSY